MAYDQNLTDRVLERLLGQPDLEQEMMSGGVLLMVPGNFT
jgi:hypothetical protein